MRWIALALAALLLTAGGAWLGFMLFLRIAFSLSVSNMPAAITLPPELKVRATVINELDIHMDGDISADVPLQQTLILPVRGRYMTEVEIDTPVRVKFDVVYDGTIPVDTYADITARAHFNFEDVKRYRNLQFDARLPMQMNLPVRLTAPVDDNIQFQYRGRLPVEIDQDITAPVDIRIPAILRVDQQFRTPVRTSFDLLMQTPDHPIRLIANQLDLNEAVRELRLEQTEAPDGPLRMDSPWGPAEDEPPLRPRRP